MLLVAFVFVLSPVLLASCGGGGQTSTEAGGTTATTKGGTTAVTKGGGTTTKHNETTGKSAEKGTGGEQAKVQSEENVESVPPTPIPEPAPAPTPPSPAPVATSPTPPAAAQGFGPMVFCDGGTFNDCTENVHLGSSQEPFSCGGTVRDVSGCTDQRTGEASPYCVFIGHEPTEDRDIYLCGPAPGLNK